MILARFRRWRHLMRWMLHGHRAEDLYFRRTPVQRWQLEALNCSCGTNFWHRQRCNQNKIGYYAVKRSP